MSGHNGLSCFVITPIGEEASDLRREIDGIIDACIYPSLLAYGFSVDNVYIPHRMDIGGMISYQIMEKIHNCDLVIANLTGLNPNVMYELAARHSTGKPTIQICNKNTSLPFDTKDVRTLFYTDNTQGGITLMNQLKTRIQNDMSYQHMQLNPITQLKDSSNPIPHFKNAIAKLGISNIYIKPEDRPIRDEISSAKEICFLAYAGDNFMERYRTEFASAFRNGASIYMLIGRKGSDFFKEIDLMESIPIFTHEVSSLDPKIATIVREIKRTKNIAQSVQGKIEVRNYNTEFRNSLTLCEDYNGRTMAWLTVMFGYKRAAESMMIEFHDGDGLEDCKQYFNKMWSLHSNDVLYHSDSDD